MSSFPHRFIVRWGLVVLSVLILISCSGRRPATSNVPPTRTAQDSLAVVPDSTVEATTVQPVSSPGRVLLYDSSNFREPSSSYDIQHTTLSLSFDFPNERVIGSAVHRLTSTVQLLTHLQFDARDMEIREVSIRRPDTEFRAVPFQYNNADLTISLQPGVGKTVALEVRIDYVAHPTRNGRKLGMVFVDGKGTDPSRPTQVWTLGEPEDNQYWFPTWDYPNDRMTFDLSLTVPQHFSTIANGDLVEQTALTDGMRRDRWVLNKPQVAYLAGFAIGEFAAEVVDYTRRDGSSVPLAYLVEPEFAGKATLVFGETPDMMGFFERNLGVAYPWSNYKQVCVRELTARGMENTTATLLYDGLQHDERAHLDFTGRDLILHELAHQWFGNMVTARNWANIALNEGFATYFERLYLEQQHGIAEAQKHAIDDRNAYLREAETLRRPIVWYGYTNPDDVFDHHSYEKAAMVLHQLRFELGDDVWWRGVRQFLTVNAYREVVLEDFQKAMEQAAGRGLGGFFQQWYQRPGHPELQVQHSYKADIGVYEVKVHQAQDSLRIGTFAFDVDIEVNIPNATPWVSRYRVATRDTTFRFAIVGDLSFVRFDAGDWVPGDIRVRKSLTEWLNQARYDDEPAGRYDAVVALAQYRDSAFVNVRNVLLQILQSDDAAFVREAAAEALVAYAQQNDVRPYFLQAVKTDQDARVRRRALTSLSGLYDSRLQEALRAGIADASYEVTAEAIRIYSDAYPQEALQQMRPLYGVRSWNQVVEKAMIGAYAKIRAIEGVPYLQDLLAPEMKETVQIASIGALSSIGRSNPDIRSSVAQSIANKLTSPLEPVRFAAAGALEPIVDQSIVARLNDHLQRETSDRVRQVILRMVNAGN